jgi:HlyD family secretion protein/epimerase transport system membrane fusion protein
MNTGKNLVSRPAGGASLAHYTPRLPAHDTEALSQSVARPARAGFVLMVLFFGGFVVWGSLAPLAGGAVAPGVISPDGSKRTVQHLEGGIIAKLLVRDGDRVEAGQPLVELHGINARATHDMLSYQRYTLLATRARLEAEANGASDIAFPEEFAADPAVIAMTEAQRHIFTTRRTTHEARASVLKQRITQLDEQIRGYEAQVKSASRQMTLLTDELKGKEQLYAKGLLRKPDLLQLQRMHAEIGGRHGEYSAQIARARQEIGEARLQILTLDAERSDKIASHLDEIRVKLAEIEERLPASSDVLQRTTIRAPVAGTVLNLKFKNSGAVVLAGEAILDIVPSKDALVIEAKVSPLDIDAVHAGMSAQVHLTAFSSRGTPRIPGVVRTVSADTITDKATHQSYYVARVEVDRAEMARLASGAELIPGMPAEVLIITGERTMIAYLLQPFMDALRRSFRQG